MLAVDSQTLSSHCGVEAPDVCWGCFAPDYVAVISGAFRHQCLLELRLSIVTRCRADLMCWIVQVTPIGSWMSESNHAAGKRFAVK